MDNIESVVTGHIPFMYGESSKGWRSVYCEVCGDGTHTKGTRGGWNFDDSGDVCFYNCFNCGIDGNFDPHREHPFSKKMYEIFRAFNIPLNEINELLIKTSKDPKHTVKRQERINLPSIPQPDFWKLMSEWDDDNPLAEEAREFLWERYHMKDTDYPFYLSTGKTNSDLPDQVYQAKYLKPRIIIPAYNNDRLMYWQARIFFGSDANKKYISATVENSNAVIYGMNQLYVDDPENHPLYVGEGFFDMWHLNGVAVITNTMKESKVRLLERSRRPKVIVPDYNKDGMNLANQGIELGWGVALPDVLPANDICKAIELHGKLYVLKSLVEHTYFGFEAKMRLKDFQLQNYKFLS